MGECRIRLAIGFTTFSTFGRRNRRSSAAERGPALLNILGNVALGLVAVLIGLAIGSRLFLS